MGSAPKSLSMNASPSSWLAVRLSRSPMPTSSNMSLGMIKLEIDWRKSCRPRSMGVNHSQSISWRRLLMINYKTLNTSLRFSMRPSDLSHQFYSPALWMSRRKLTLMVSPYFQVTWWWSTCTSFITIPTNGSIMTSTFLSVLTQKAHTSWPLKARSVIHLHSLHFSAEEESALEKPLQR